MNLFLADSSAWLALYDRRDKFHTQAIEAFNSVVNQKVTFVVTDLILVETVTLLLYRAGHAQAVICGEWLLHSPRVRLIRVNIEQWDESWKLFKQYDDKQFSFTDCTSFVVMRHLKLRDAFTFDHHFEQMGFRLWTR
jgi:predicted nucleic acid-binding protein